MTDQTPTPAGLPAIPHNVLADVVQAALLDAHTLIRAAIDQAGAINTSAEGERDDYTSPASRAIALCAMADHKCKDALRAIEPHV